MKTSSKVKDLICHILFVSAFIFVASGMLEAVVLKLMSLVGW